jgi:hypothetical protein
VRQDLCGIILRDTAARPMNGYPGGEAMTLRLDQRAVLTQDLPDEGLRAVMSA